MYTKSVSRTSSSSSRLSYDVAIPADDTTALIQANNSNAGTYQEVFKATKFGKWHFLLLAQCGWANASDAIEIMCVSFTIDSLKDSLNIEPAEGTWLSVVLFLGMMFGGYMWGTLADSWGRRQVVIYSLALNGIFGAASSFSRSYWLILVLRFISGLGAGGSLPVCFSYFSEFQPNEKRGAMISALATFWMAGNVLTAGLAWLIIPSNFTTLAPYGETWRFFIIVCAIPSLSSSLFFYFMPESPKFLMQKGKSEEAYKVLKRIHSINNPGEPFPFGSISKVCKKDTNYYSSDYTVHRNSSVWCGICSFCCSIWRTIRFQVKSVFGSGSKTSRDSLILMTVTFSIAFGGYGLSMWLPSLMEKMEQNAGSPCDPKPINVTVKTGNNSTDMYVDVFIGAAAQLPANIFTIAFIDRFGGKIVVCISLILSGLSVLFLYLVKSKLHVILVSAAFNCATTLVWNGLDVVTPEMYSTSIRAAATGLITALSRIASILGTVIFGAYMDVNCNIPLLTTTGVLLFGGLLSFLLPNTRQIELR